MPPEGTADAAVTGRCYCGAVTLTAPEPATVAACHCADCRRVTGAPFTVWAGFAPDAVRFMPSAGPEITVTPGVRRWFCRRCGSPLAAVFDYLPGKVWVPLGILDQADRMPPASHSWWDRRMPWLHLSDDATKLPGSSRTVAG